MMCVLTAAIFTTRNDSRVSKDSLRQSGSVVDLVIEHADVFTLREATRQSGASISAAHSTAVAEFLGGGGGLKRNPTPGMGRHVLNSSTTAACQFCSLFWAESTIPSLSDPRDDHALARARYCWPVSNYPVTLHDCSSGPPPSAASAAEASLPVPRSPRTSFLSGMRPVPRSRPAPTFVEVCRVRHGPLLVGMSRGLRCVC